MNLFTNNKILAPLFGLMVFLFYAFLYPFHLNYQEQYQLFLFTSDYLGQALHKPGGLSDYIGNFLTQFYFYHWFGAAILAILLTALQQLVWGIAKKMGASGHFLLLSFVPSVAYWGLLSDENYLLGGLIAILLPLAAIATYQSINNQNLRRALTIALLPVLYWMAGGAFLMMVAFVVANELIIHRNQGKATLLFLALVIGISLLMPFLTKHYLLQYPLMRAWIGTNYSRFAVGVPYGALVVMAIITVWPFAIKWSSQVAKPSSINLLMIIQVLVLSGGGFFVIRSSADFGKEEVMAYDFYCRMRKWDKVIQLADKKTPSSPLSVACLNLALGKMDLLGERMFHYYQKGTQGLLPDFVRDYTIPLVANEIYYQLGMVNTSQRYSFEAMEALPDYQKSARVVMRLAETNIINGNYAVATKYLHLLQNTFYYKKWATNALAAIQDEKLVSEHTEWGWLRKCRMEEDFLFSEGEKDMMLGLLFQHNPQNRLAYEYLMAYALLNKDLQHFWQYLPLGESLQYKTLPKSYQEAAAYVWAILQKKPLNASPVPISATVVERMKAFGSMLTASSTPEQDLMKGYGDSYWYYLQFRK